MIINKIKRPMILVLVILGLALCQMNSDQKLLTDKIDDNHVDPFNIPMPNTPLGRIREFASTSLGDITFISEKDGAFKVIYYHDAVDEFHEIYNVESEWANNCSNYQFSFVTDGNGDKAQFGCQVNPTLATVIMYDFVKKEYFFVTSGKRLVSVHTSLDGLRFFVRFEENWHVFVRMGPLCTDLVRVDIDLQKHGLDKIEVKLANFWGDDSILIVTEDQAIQINFQENSSETIIDLPGKGVNKQITSFDYFDKNITLMIKFDADENPGHYALFSQKNDEQEFTKYDLHLDPDSLTDYFLASIKQIFYDPRTDSIYLIGVDTIFKVKPKDDNKTHLVVSDYIYTSEAIPNFWFMRNTKSDIPKSLFVGYRDEIITAFDPDTKKAEVLSIDHSKTIYLKTTSNGVHIEQEGIKDKNINREILRIGDYSEIDFTINSDQQTFDLIDSYKIENCEAGQKQYVIFLVDKKTNETVIEKRVMVNGFDSHNENVFRLPIDDVEMIGGDYLVNFNQRLQTVMSCQGSFCYEKHIDSKEDPVSYNVITFGCTRVYHNKDEIFLLSAFNTFVYKKNEMIPGKYSHFIQYGGDQITHDYSDSEVKSHVVYGTGFVWKILTDHPDRTDGQMLIKDVYDLLHLNDDLVIMRSHQDVSIRHKDSLDKVQWSAETNVMKDDQFLYKKDKGVYEDKTKHTVITSSYHKYNLLYDSNTHKVTMTFMKKNDNGFHDQLSEESFIVHENRVKEGKNERILSPGDIADISENAPITKEIFIAIIYIFCIIAIGVVSIAVVYAILRLCSKNGTAHSLDYDKKTKQLKKKKLSEDAENRNHEARYQANLNAMAHLNGYSNVNRLFH